MRRPSCFLACGLAIAATALVQLLGPLLVPGPRRIYEYENIGSLASISSDRLFFLAVLGFLSLGPRALAAARNRRRGPSIGALLIAVVLLDGLAWVASGSEVAGLFAVPAAAWLAWTLRRARAVHEARPRGVGEPPPPSAGPATS